MRIFCMISLFLTVGWVSELQASDDLDVANRGYLGFSAEYEKAAQFGELRVFWINPQGPAIAAGLQEGDVVFAINGESFSFINMAELQQGLKWIRIGTDVELSYRRGGAEHRTRFAAATYPQELQQNLQAQAERNQRFRPFEAIDSLASSSDHLLIHRLPGGNLDYSLRTDASFDKEGIALYFARPAMRKLVDTLKPGDHVELRLSQAESGRNRVTTNLEVAQASSTDLARKLAKRGYPLRFATEAEPTDRRSVKTASRSPNRP